MDTKLAVVAIIVSDLSGVERINALLHDFGEYIIGRLGLPYKQKKVNVISVVIDAPQEVISSLSGKLGMIDGVSSKVLTTK
ncbi:MAG: iron-only hydrogenase system regulator [Clostridia bacterium]|nr:iron-only hydrogenase system regulator [Clostridia bacterium]